jgi:hypothetical protein
MRPILSRRMPHVRYRWKYSYGTSERCCQWDINAYYYGQRPSRRDQKWYHSPTSGAGAYWDEHGFPTDRNRAFDYCLCPDMALEERRMVSTHYKIHRPSGEVVRRQIGGLRRTVSWLSFGAFVVLPTPSSRLMGLRSGFCSGRHDFRHVGKQEASPGNARGHQRGTVDIRCLGEKEKEKLKR